ncbi:hydantoinase/oxoprolinase family protein [Actinomadura chibensis]|uniref:Hydantoinase/oxoprolinase family protein n=1 Tax=Actinomadura chibensis TaxID=392828 RepID=A0A5D0NP72_9ACTN|nr:hydantoinase/oxoprolinase family protein [Actinomadura chibensis]TYB46316.1 hydantoinase/oxoprolinase family protein [Actinomadura chibensis]
MASEPVARASVDIGGTFTDLVLEQGRTLRLFKSPTVPGDPVQGILDVLAMAAESEGEPLADLLGRVETFTHATTRGLNAVLTGGTAKTAFLTTEGHPDVLLLREGGRRDPYDFTVPYPEPYVPRSLTFEVGERVASDGRVTRPLDLAGLERTCDRLVEEEVEAVAVCLLWSTVNPGHELAVGEVLERRLPGVPYTLSHALNPSLREYRRASSACLDASLKPLMSEYIGGLTTRLRAAGLAGRILMVTSIGGVVDVADAAAAPILTINSGPSMAPVAGRAYAASDLGADTVIVADAGGTTYDVTLVRGGEIPSTRSAWVGAEGTGHMTGLPSIDVKSVGAGGGSIAWVDAGGLLRVGPRSAGSVPGPACYGRGGARATVTDAALVLGYLDPAGFSSGRMTLDAAAARAAVAREVAEPLGFDLVTAAHAVIELTTEQMVRAIEDIAFQQGIDPARAALVGGGGAAGLNAAAVARRLGAGRLVIPAVGAALAAAGALMSDLTAVHTATVPVLTSVFEAAKVNAALAGLRARGREFAVRVGADPSDAVVTLFAEARYPQQIWELEVPLRVESFASGRDVDEFAADFHAVHQQVLGITDERSPVEVVSWGARVRVPLREAASALATRVGGAAEDTVRRAYVPGRGMTDVPVRRLAAIAPGEVLRGPMLVESPFTTLVVTDTSVAEPGASGSLIITPPREAAAPVAARSETR